MPYEVKAFEGRKNSEKAIEEFLNENPKAKYVDTIVNTGVVHQGHSFEMTGNLFVIVEVPEEPQENLTERFS